MLQQLKRQLHLVFCEMLLKASMKLLGTKIIVAFDKKKDIKFIQSLISNLINTCYRCKKICVLHLKSHNASQWHTIVKMLEMSVFDLRIFVSKSFATSCFFNKSRLQIIVVNNVAKI